MASFDRWWTNIDSVKSALSQCPFYSICSLQSVKVYQGQGSCLIVMFLCLCKFYQQLTIIDQIDNSDLQEGASTLEVDVKKVQEELVKQGARIH